MGKRWIVLVLSMALSVSAGAAGATFPGTNGRIAFVSDRDGNFEIYSMEPDGSTQTRLTTSPGDERNPSWSPEGRRIAYDRNAYVHVLADDGSYDVPVRRCFFDSQPSWSPDGTKHLVYRQYGKAPYLLTRSINGSDEHRLEGAAVTIGSPEWSPDGEAVAFENESFSIDNRQYGGIWLMDADGTDAREVTDSENNDSMPSWHPSSQRLAFASQRDGQLEIYSVGVDGTDLVRLTENAASDFDPAWSPDGAKIAFVSNRDGGHEIYVMDADGSNVTRLTNNDANEADPDWQSVASASVPAPPEGPQVSCREKVERFITLELRGHLTATGSYTETGDDDSRCGFDLRVERRTPSRWKRVSAPVNLEGDRYSVEIPDRPGRYRARLSRSVAGFYTDRYRDVCSAAVTETQVHRH